MCTGAADKEFDELCFDFGIELDDVVGNNYFFRPNGTPYIA